MELTTLGRTGLQVSVAGLGCGGHSRLGLSNGGSEDDAIAVVHRALDLGINLIDTARIYGTEEVVGRALAGRRDEVILSTKAMPDVNGELLSAEGLRRSVEKSLGRLRTDHVDLFFLHGIGVKHLEHCRDVLGPELARLREEGKVRYAAASEAFARDTDHKALTTALDAGDDWFDVAMVGFNLLNPSARGRLLAATQTRGIGVLVMFAVRRALSDPEVCRALVADLVAQGAVDPAADSRQGRSPRLPRPPRRRHFGRRCRLPLRPPRARLRCRAHRHRECRPSRAERALDHRGTAPRGRPRAAASDVRHRRLGQRQLTSHECVLIEKVKAWPIDMDQQERRHVVANQYIAALSSPNEETLAASPRCSPTTCAPPGSSAPGRDATRCSRRRVLLRTHCSRPLSGTLPRSTVMSHRCAARSRLGFRSPP